MTEIIEHFKAILTEWQKSEVYQQNLADFGSEIKVDFNSPISDEKISEIERLLGQRLPADLVKLYQFADGGADFIGDEWIASEQIISELKWSAEQKKPEQPAIENPSASAALEKDITAFYRTLAPKNGIFGKKNWFKMEFGGSPNSLDGLYLLKSSRPYICLRKLDITGMSWNV